MLKNHLKIAFRGLLAHKYFSLISITGLSVSAALCILLIRYIQFETGFDTVHTKSDRIFRLEMTDLLGKPDTAQKPFDLLGFLPKGDQTKNGLVFPLKVTGDIKTNFAEVENAMRIKWYHTVIRHGNDNFKVDRIAMTDNSIFSMLTLPLKNGNRKTALVQPDDAVISQDMADRIFGKNPAIGQVLMIENRPFTVGAVLSEIPLNSSFRPDVLIPTHSDEHYAEGMKSHNAASIQILLELKPGTDVSRFSKKLNQWSKDYFAEYVDAWKSYAPEKAAGFNWFLRPLTECHFNPSQPWRQTTDVRKLYQLALLTGIILFTAAFNYILMMLSRIAARIQEMSIRKSLGVRSGGIIIQLLVETQLLVAISLTIGLLLAALFKTPAETLLATKLELFPDKSSLLWFALTLIAFNILLVAITGLLPAWKISSLAIAGILKQQHSVKISTGLSRTLVVLQYTGCTALIICALVIYRQMKFISNRDLGFDQDQVILIKNVTWDAEKTRRFTRQLRDVAQKESTIKAFGTGAGLDGTYNRNGFSLDGTNRQFYSQLYTGYGLIELLDLKLIAGRGFDLRFASSDTARGADGRMPRKLIINESFYKLLGDKAKLGQPNDLLGSATVIGVVKDFHYASLNSKIEPLALDLYPDVVPYFYFKVQQKNVNATLDRLRSEWATITGNELFDHSYLNDNLAKMYEKETIWSQTILFAAFFSIGISVLGLLGLSSISANNRTKEIGIRKVLGSSVTSIVSLLSREYVWMALLATLIATPIAFYFMQLWLQDFAYKIELHWSLFVVAGILSIVIAFLSVGFQSVKAALANPVKSLRSE